MSLLSGLFGRFRPIATIYVDGGNIVFKRGADEARSEPLIRFAEDGMVIEVGRPAVTATGGRLVQLFSDNGGDDEDAIRAFCRYHLMLTADANPLRPRITILEPSFRNSFGSHAAIAIQKVLRAEGLHADLTDATA